MALESVTNIADLVVTNPTNLDPKSEGDDHIRNIKKALKNDLPNITGPITANQAELNVLDGITASTAELNLLDGVTATTAELNHVDGVTSPIQTQLDGKQPVDADLTAIAGLSSAGMVARTGAGTASVRTLTAGAGITITNGDGVSGNPTIAVNATDLPNSAAVVSYTPAGTGAVATTVQSKLREWVSVKDFGASDTASDAVNTAAVQAAAATGLPFSLAGLTINLTGSATITNDVYGPGKLLMAGTMLSVGGDDVVVDGVEFEGTATSGTFAPVAVSAIDRSRVTVRNCHLKNCRVNMRNTALARQTDFRFQNNTVDADFTLIEHVTNQNDVVTVRGIDGVWITGNNFTVLNVHRVLKIADTEAATTSGTAFRGRNVFVTNNRIVGSTDSEKQVMDLYFFTSDITVSQNMIEVTGFGVVLENKTGEAQNYTQNTFITGNKMSNDFAGISLQGSYGATTGGYDVGYQNALIADNVVISTAPSVGVTRRPIEVRFYDNVEILGNNVVTPVAFSETTGSGGIVVISNAYATVNNNTITNGAIFFTRATTNSAAQPFTSTMLSIVCSGNTVNNFGGTGFIGGIQVDNTGTASSLRVLIEGNYIKQDVDDGNSSGCVGINNSTVNTVSVCNNVGVMANTTEQRLRLLTSTVTQIIERDNSWNQVGRATATYDPPSIAGGGTASTTMTVTGAAFATDSIDRLQFSRALGGLVMTGWVSSTDTVTVQFYNPTASPIDLASGSLQVVVGRYTAV